ncbi:MAG: leucine-rich repeat protein [Lachnospiraceae bacterium]|nr:leucine-rich repeat protein [Lachnospiraceae bacterium]
MKPKKLITALIILAILIAGAMVAWNRFGKETGGDITPTPTATVAPTESVEPTTEPTVEPTPTAEPTATNTPVPTAEPTPEPTEAPMPTEEPTPTAEPTPTEIPVHVHVWEKKEVKPTCTEGGRTWEECACGEIQNEVILNALGHGELIYTVISSPTVETEGEYEESCSVCKEVVNRGNIVKLSPTPVPTSTPTPTPTNTPTPTPTNTPTPTPTSTPTPKPTNTPVPTATSTPIPSPTAKPVFGEIVIGGGETNISLISMEPVEYVITLVGDPGATELEYTLSRNDLLNVRLEQGTTERQYTLRLQSYGINGKAGIVLTLYGKDEYGNRTVCDEVTLSVKVELKAYDPVEDGYPYYVETLNGDGITLELWAESETSIHTVLIVNGEGTVSYKTVGTGSWDAIQKRDRVRKIVFGEGITEIQKFLTTSYTEEIVLPSTLKSIGAGAFQKAKLTEAIIPEGVEKIDDCAFMWCNQLEKVNLPSTLKSIGMSTFAASTQSPNKYTNYLLEVFIPKSVEFINYAAFEYHYGLVITVEAGTDTSGYEKEWYCSGSSVPHTVIYE